jgi:hypothetical protein
MRTPARPRERSACRRRLLLDASSPSSTSRKRICLEHFFVDAKRRHIGIHRRRRLRELLLGAPPPSSTLRRICPDHFFVDAKRRRIGVIGRRQLLVRASSLSSTAG